MGTALERLPGGRRGESGSRVATRRRAKWRKQKQNRFKGPIGVEVGDDVAYTESCRWSGREDR